MDHKGWQFWAPEEGWWRHGYVYPTQLAVDTLPRILRPIFAPGGEALAVEVIYWDAPVFVPRSALVYSLFNG